MREISKVLQRYDYDVDVILSCDVKGTFSMHNFIFTDMRNKLDPENVKKIVTKFHTVMKEMNCLYQISLN